MTATKVNNDWGPRCEAAFLGAVVLEGSKTVAASPPRSPQPEGARPPAHDLTFAPEGRREPRERRRTRKNCADRL